MNRPSGLLLVNKTAGSTSFQIVSLLRRLTKVEKIGHAGTLDPFATGLMILLIGRNYTQRSNDFLMADKEYRATMHFGIATDTYDKEGTVIHRSDLIPSSVDVERALFSFQGEILQIPPMFSAKKIQGKKLCDLARRGIEVKRQPALVRVAITLLRYDYPELECSISCSKGTYIRSLAHDLGKMLGCGAHLTTLVRTRSGKFSLDDAIDQERLKDPACDITPYLRHL